MSLNNEKSLFRLLMKDEIESICKGNKNGMEMSNFHIMDFLISALMGFSVEYFKYVENDEGELICEFNLKETSTGIIELSEKIVEIGLNYIKIRNLLNLDYIEKIPVSNSHLYSSIEEILDHYIIFICDLEKLFRNDRLTFTQLWAILQFPKKVLEKLLKIVIEVKKKKLKGALIQKLINKTKKELLKDDPLNQILKNISKEAIKPINQMVFEWINYGHITDPHKEFFIKLSDKIRSNFNFQFSGRFWDEMCKIREISLIPDGISTEKVDLILKTGKMALVVTDLKKRFGIFSDVHLEKPSMYASIKVIHKIYDHYSCDLIKTLNQKMDLQKLIYDVAFILLVRSKIYFNFFNDLIINYEKSSNVITLYKALFNNSFSENNKVKEIFQLKFADDKLQEKLYKILATGEEEVILKEYYSINDYKTVQIEMLELNVKVIFPISIVLSRKALTKYQLIFRYIFRLKILFHLLENKPFSFRRLSKKISKAEFWSSLHQFYVYLNFIVLSLIQYFEYFIIEPRLKDFKNVFTEKEFNSIENICIFQNNFLDSIIRDLFISNWDIFCQILKIFEVGISFLEVISNFENELNINDRFKYLKETFLNIINELIDLFSQVQEVSYDNKLSFLIDRFNTLKSAFETLNN